MNKTKLLKSACLMFTALGAGFAQAEEIYYGVQFEEFEFRATEHGGELFVWDADSFIGTDDIKLRWKFDGEWDLDENYLEGLSNQLALQTPVSDFWDVKAGIQFDSPEGPDRFYGLIGLSGLAPQWIEMDLDLLVSEKGKASAVLDMEYELLLTNYLILTPSLEISGAFSGDKEIGVGSGINGTEVGFRLSYDLIDRTVSPYVGLVYERKFGETADLAKDEGEETASWQFSIGAKFLF
ncbi:copper resistance protein B [Sneathiella sp. P13V-1]|uniref:copper resistance protein B n=1 Tax=Sneathiella sp. P13V-1 TaxID=2697366 RepID=UPI00187B980C|nr:copper resistance protein B [Sneathiella sp. P13V-1]MBE7636187.1 copper resistance protein B [Sneathiella sp. P13V-1]